MFNAQDKFQQTPGLISYSGVTSSVSSMYAAHYIGDGWPKAYTHVHMYM